MSRRSSRPAAAGIRTLPLRWRVLLNALVISLLLLLVLGALEIGFRVLSPQTFFALTVNTWDPQLGTKQIPGARGFVTCPEYTTDLVINSKGLRDREYPYAKPSDVTRILCLGDSYTCGYGVSAHQSFPKVLDKLLNRSAGVGPGWEVINAGVGSTGTAHQFAYFTIEGYKYSPDIVILCMCPHNDFMDNNTCGMYSLVNGQLVKSLAPRTGPRKLQRFVRWIPAYRSLFAKSHLLNFLKQRLAARHFHRLVEKSAVPTTGDAAETQYLALTRSLLSALCEACSTQASRFILMVIPPDDRGHMVSRTARIIEYAQGVGMECLELEPCFQEYRQRGVPLCFSSDRHWNVMGHRAAAEALYAYLVSTGDVPPDAR